MPGSIPRQMGIRPKPHDRACAMTQRTLSEITATCTKAARGNGCPWGLAEEAGMAARLLSSHGLPGAEIMADILTAERSCNCTGRRYAPACGIAALADLSDRMTSLRVGTEIRTGPVVAPVALTAPLLMAAKRHRRCFQITWPEATLICTPNGLSGSVPCPRRSPPSAVTISVVENATDAVPPDPRARRVDDAVWAVLERLAAKTYVPETEASRASGAGADRGVSD